MTIAAAALPTSTIVAHPIYGDPGRAMIACPDCGAWRRRTVISRTTPVVECHGEVLAVMLDAEPFRPEWLRRFCGQDTISPVYALWAAGTRR